MHSRRFWPNGMGTNDGSREFSSSNPRKDSVRNVVECHDLKALRQSWIHASSVAKSRAGTMNR